MQRPESEIRAHDEEVRHHGLGMDLRTVGERRLVGHSGGFPGHVTRTWIDPGARVVVSVLTNAIDGPADVLARGRFGLLDLALAAPAREEAAPPPAGDLARFAGRFANLWGSPTSLCSVAGWCCCTPAPRTRPRATWSSPGKARTRCGWSRWPASGPPVRPCGTSGCRTARRPGCGSAPVEVFRRRRALQVHEAPAG